MKVVDVATLDSRAYYSITNRLRMTNLRFRSLTPIQAQANRAGLIITTEKERDLFASASISIEDLDEDPLIMEGQILSRISPGHTRNLLIGVDPGSRTGVVVFYGDSKLGSFTVESVEELQLELFEIIRHIPNGRVTIKIGNGAPRLCRSIVQGMRSGAPDVTIEVVDERGTTTNRSNSDGLTGDQRAAAKIARRKGSILTGLSKSR